MNTIFMIMLILFNITFNVCYLLNTTEEDYYYDFIDRKWYARVYMYMFYWLAFLIRTRLIRYVARLAFSVLIEVTLFYSIIFFDYEDGLVLWLTLIIFGCFCIAAYQCTIWDYMIAHIKKRRKYYAKNSKNC